MKLFVAFASFIALCAGSTIPLVPGDNSHYVEGESRYIWMPDGEGVPQLVDLHERPDEELLRNTKDGNNNQYWLLTRSNPTSVQVITHGNTASISNSNYDGRKPLNIIVHGWNNNGNTEMNPLITAAFLSAMDANVIVVDWRGLASSNYFTAMAGVPSVGQHLGNFLIWLINTAGGNWNNVHLVGFSLGAHIVGNAGRTTGGRPSRVTGLDPAGPMWIGNSNALTTTDAQYVETINTDGRLLGIFNPIGVANFYPNGGRNPQPGCSLSTCSHGRSTELFAASVQFNHFSGRQCNSINEVPSCNGTVLNMGNSIMSKRGSGIFGLITASSWPF